MDLWLFVLAVGVFVTMCVVLRPRKCSCGHTENDHIGEIFLVAGPEPHPGVCLGDDFRCRCMGFEET